MITARKLRLIGAMLLFALSGLPEIAALTQDGMGGAATS